MYLISIAVAWCCVHHTSHTHICGCYLQPNVTHWKFGTRAMSWSFNLYSHLPGDFSFFFFELESSPYKRYWYVRCCCHPLGFYLSILEGEVNVRCGAASQPTLAVGRPGIVKPEWNTNHCIAVPCLALICATSGQSRGVRIVSPIR